RVDVEHLVVAPHAGAWIETCCRRPRCPAGRGSPLTRGRGLKHPFGCRSATKAVVAPHAGAGIETVRRGRDTASRGGRPHAGAWLETSSRSPRTAGDRVAPHAGAWIETGAGRPAGCGTASSPLTRGRGLKPLPAWNQHSLHHVAPHAGAWIETC